MKECNEFEHRKQNKNANKEEPDEEEEENEDEEGDTLNQSDFEELIADGLINADKLPALLAPTAYGKIFMVHYVVSI